MTIRQQQQDCELAWVPTHLLGRSQYCRMRFITRFNQKDPRELQEAGLERTGATETRMVELRKLSNGHLERAMKAEDQVAIQTSTIMVLRDRAERAEGLVRDMSRTKAACDGGLGNMQIGTTMYCKADDLERAQARIKELEALLAGRPQPIGYATTADLDSMVVAKEFKGAFRSLCVELMMDDGLEPLYRGAPPGLNKTGKVLAEGWIDKTMVGHQPVSVWKTKDDLPNPVRVRIVGVKADPTKTTDCKEQLWCLRCRHGQVHEAQEPCRSCCGFENEQPNHFVLQERGSGGRPMGDGEGTCKKTSTKREIRCWMEGSELRTLDGHPCDGYRPTIWREGTGLHDAQYVTLTWEET